MFFGFLLLLSRAANDDYKYELKHIYNPDCDEYVKDSKGTITITSTDGFLGTHGYYLRECKNLDDVQFNLAAVPNYAFYASSLKTITLSKETLSIGEGAFAFCQELQTVTFADPTDFSTLSNGAFYHSSVTSFVKFPDITTINDETFEGCSLKGYTFDFSKSKLTKIENRAFHSSEISGIIFSNDMNEIKESAFQNCSNLNVGGNPKTIKCNKIGDLAFANCPMLTGITVISTEVGISAFQCDPEHPTAITSIQQIQPSTGTYSPLNIKSYAFYGRSITLNGLATYYGIKINDFAFAFCSFTNVGQGNSGYGISIINENSAITIGDHAFYRTKLNSNANTPFRLDIGQSNGASTIGYHAFESSEGHLKLSFSTKGSPVSINDYAFYRSGVFNSNANDEGDFLRLLERVSSIGEKSFAQCQLIAGGVYIRSTKIGEYAFYDCKNIKKIVIYDSEIPKGAFEACTGDITNLTITDNRILTGSTTAQQTIKIGDRAFYSSGLNCELVLHSFISEIGEYAFAYCKNLGNRPLTIYAGEIKPYAFASCAKFSSPIVIYSPEIDYHCFDESTLTDVRISKINGGSTKINTEAFYDISFEGLLNIEEDVTIDYNAFQLCRFSANIVINGTIKEYAFDNCTIAKSGVTLSIGSTNVGEHAFQRFGKLNTFTLKFHDIKIASHTIYKYAFYEANISGKVEIPWCFNNIGAFAFTNCFSITELSINNSNIGNSAFLGCRGITKLELYSHGTFTTSDGKEYEGMSTIGPSAFYSLPNLASDLIIPSEVKEIYSCAFKDCGKIPRLIIELDSKLTIIDDGAFSNCTNMAGEINVCNTLVTIGEYAFFNCPKLNKLTILDNAKLSTIDQYAFHGCTTMDGVLDLPKSVNEIGDYAFYNCNGFTHHITIKSACYIGNFAFYGCNKVKRVELDFPQNIVDETDPGFVDDEDYYRYIGAYAFSNLPVYNNFHYDVDQYNPPCDEEKDDILNIPHYYYRIGESAFENCIGLRGVKFNIRRSYHYNLFDKGIMSRAFYGSSITSVYIEEHYTNNYGNNYYQIGDYAFSSCQNLKNIIISTYGDFGHCIFANCHNLVSFSISGGDFGDYIFANCTSLRGRMYISGGNFGNYLFQNCVNIAPDQENITFEMSGGSIGRYPFEGCTSFGGIVLLEGRARIKDSAFEGFNMPFILSAPIYSGYSNNVAIGRRAFYNCALVGPLDISAVSYIGNEAFANCPNTLELLSIHPVETGRNVFINTKFGNNTAPDGIVPLIVYTGSEFTQNLLHGLTFNRLFLINRDSNYGIPYKAFYEMTTLEGELEIPYSVDSIGEYAFSACGFYHIIFGATSEIKEGAFYNCKNLNDTIDFDDIDTISKRAFCGCSNLQSIIFGSSIVPTFERSAFEGCSSLNFDVRFSSTYTGTPPYTIHKYAFSGCSSLEGTDGHLVIPAYVKTIDDYAFQGCAFQHLDFLERPGTTPATTDELTLGVGAFSGCNKIKFELILPELTDNKISDRAFYGCSSIQAIEYPDSIETIGKYAFYGCSSVQGPLEIKPSVKRIEEYAFAKCSGYSGSLTINIDPKGGSQLIIGPHAFEGCSGFKDGDLNIFIESDEESSRPYQNTGTNQNQFPYFRYKYFLRIGAKAFKDTKFKNVYYNGRFQPDCDYDIGFSHTKGIHTSSNYLNKSFCSYPLHSNKLSGGAIAGIVIAVLVVVAVIVFLIIFFILKNKKNKDKSEDEIEMNQDP